jgi:lipoprotein-anchoring transpeptidase ErfK/SrfK
MRIMAICMAALLASSTTAAAFEFKRAPAPSDIYRGYEPPVARHDGKPRPSKRVVRFKSSLPIGSIVVRTGERKLYFVLDDGKALRYDVGVGREGYAWSGRDRITRKREWPEWSPPTAMLIREEKKGRTLPRVMPGGESNPLGARALYIGRTEYRIHGTAQPGTIGRAVSSGCIRMLNEEVIDLYERVEIGALVVVE